jgi:Flp pilus assembly protein TadG
MIVDFWRRRRRIDRESSLSRPPSGRWHFWVDDTAAVAVVAAMVFPVVIGGLGLGAETGYWYLSQRKLQHAVDVSAHAAGVRLRAGDSKSAIDAATQSVAAGSGFQTAVGTMVVNTPPLKGTKVGNAASVEVILTETRQRLLSSVLSDTPVVISTRAVASIVAQSKACVLALSRVAAGAVTVSGSTSVNLTGCDVAANSNAANAFLMSGSSAALSASCVYAVGGAVTTAGLTLNPCTAAKTEAPVVRDPYADVAEPSAIGACQNKNVGTPGGTTTLTPTDTQPSGVKSMRFCNGLDAKGTVTFSPGIYIIENGSLSFNGGDVNATSNVSLVGQGVTFYLRSGADLKLGGSVSLSLSAPTSGPYAGILFFGSRTSAGASQTVSGNSGSTLQGAVYMPSSAVTFTGSSSATGGCTQIVAATVTFTGNSNLKSDCAAAGTRVIATNEIVKITE